MSGARGVAGELRAIVGERHVVERASELMVYESDALPGYRKRPSLAVFPGTSDEALAIVRLLAARGLPFVPRGAGTGLAGGALADGIVLLGLQRLRRIRSVDAAAGTATVEPGVVNASLSAAVLPLGLHYAPDPSSQTACTLGGNVAENSGGPHCLKYGVTLNHVLQATVALPNGEVVTLRPPRGPGDGYDLLGAFVGSEGCFGVALDITVRLTPIPESIRTLLADFTTVEDAARATSAIVAAGILPAACELMDKGTIEAVEASIYAAGYPIDAAAVLLVEVDGGVQAVDDEAARVERICREQGARAVRVAVDPVDRARLWQGRKKAFGAMGRIAPHLFVQDAVIPRTKLAETLAAIGKIGTKHGVRICNVFHAGDGNLHPNIPYDGRNPEERARVHQAMREIMMLCIASGGSITGEHGVGLDKLPYMERLFSADTLDAMCRLRGAFDPEQRANPGKVVPVHSCREWHAVSPVVRETRAPAATAPRVTQVFAHEGDLTVERQIAEAIKVASASGRAIYIAGARTHAPDSPRNAQIVDASGRRGVVEYVPADLTITVGAGMTIAELDAITGEHGQWCPFLPWGGDSCTVGGVLATGASGPSRVALGAARDLTLGVTVVDGTGAIVLAGGRVVKNVAGFDITRAMIGSWGSLGLISSASLRLRAIPAVREAWALAKGAFDAEAMQRFVRGPFAPAAREDVPAAAAKQLGLSAEPHVVLWLAGGLAQARAARAAVTSLGHAEELAPDTWRAMRAIGPFTTPPWIAMPAELASLNARVRAAFDPRDVFAAPAMWARQPRVESVAGS